MDKSEMYLNLAAVREVCRTLDRMGGLFLQVGLTKLAHEAQNAVRKLSLAHDNMFKQLEQEGESNASQMQEDSGEIPDSGIERSHSENE